MEELVFEIVDEQATSLEEIGVAEGCTTSSSSSSLDISEVEFE